MIPKLPHSRALYGLFLRVAGGSQLMYVGSNQWDEADLPIYTAGLLLAGACILIGVLTKVWSGIGMIGLTPVIIHLNGLDGLLCVIVLFVILVEGPGTFSMDEYIAKRRLREPSPES